MKKLAVALVLCVTALPAFARPADSLPDLATRFRDRLVRIIRVVRLFPTGDALQPPLPPPQPKP